MNEIFKDLTIVELASVLAGPLAGSFFAELGAKVIKIENAKTNGDVTRQWKLPKEDPLSAKSAYYHAANYGKQVEILDLSLEYEYQKLMLLLDDADVVLSNFQKSTAEKLKVDAATICQRWPNLIYAQLNAYDYENPNPGYDLVMQAETGYLSMCGTDEDHLAKMPVAMIDVLAAHQIKEAVLLAMLERAKSGKGSRIDVSLYQSGISALVNQASNYLMENHVPKPLGTLHPNIAPYGDIVRTNDGKLLILAVGSDKQFEKLGKTLSFDGVFRDKFQFNKHRIEYRAELMKYLREKCQVFSFQELEKSWRSSNIPFCVINSLKDVFEHPLAKDMILRDDSDSLSPQRVSNIAFTINVNV